MNRIIFLALVVSLGLNASEESKKSSEQKEAAVAQEVKRLRNELRRIDHISLSPHRDIVACLVRVHKISPNDISYGWGDEKPLAHAVRDNDIFFAS